MKLSNILYLSIFAVFFTSCFEDQSGINSSNDFDGVSAYDLPDMDIELNEEQAALVKNLMDRKDHNIALQATANWGQYSSNENASYTLQGHYPADLKITVGEKTYASVNEENMEYYRDANLASVFGKTSKFTLTSSENQETFNSYIPQKLNAPKLGPNPSTMSIERNSAANILKWDPDPNDELGVVVLSYTARGGNGHDPTAGKIVGHDILILTDDGEFDVNKIIASEETNAIQFTLYRGRAFVFDDTLFSVVANDMHLYEVEERIRGGK